MSFSPTLFEDSEEKMFNDTDSSKGSIIGFSKLISNQQNKNNKVEFTELLEYNHHSTCLLSLVYFPPPYSKIVTVSGSGNFNIYCSKTYQNLHVSKKYSWIYHSVLFRKDCFLFCSDDKYVRCVSILPENNYSIKRSFVLPLRCRRLASLTDDLFLCKTTESGLFVLSYSAHKVILKINVGRCRDACLYDMELSRNYENCFYIPTQDKTQTIRLVNYTNGVILKEFKDHFAKTDEYIYSIDLIHTRSQKELLIALPTTNDIFCYDVSEKRFDVNKKIEHPVSNDRSGFQTEHSSKVWSSFSFNNQYLICGDYEGNTSIYEFKFISGGSEIKEVELIGRKKTNVSYIFDVKMLETKGRNEMRLMTGGSDSRLRIYEIKGLNFKLKKSKLEEEDEKERIFFLGDGRDLFVFGVKKIFIKIKLENLVMEDLCRIFFL